MSQMGTTVPRHLTMNNFWSQDEKYYFSDGDVIILVSKVLFKVHRHVLARDSSSFEDMFLSDQESKAHVNKGFKQDGGGDMNPIKLHGDEVDQFRDLLWALYALPQEIMISTTSEGDMTRLSNIARMAHKYNFVTTENWALRALFTRLTNMRCSEPLQTSALLQITEAAILSEDVELLDAVRAKWKAAIRSRKDLGATIASMERLGIRDLAGLAYHTLLLLGKQKWDQEPYLEREHRIRLLSGYHNLTELCDAFPDTAPAINHLPTCVDNDECNDLWAELWSLINSHDPDYGIGIQALQHHKLDILGRAMMAVSVMRAIVDGVFPGRGEYGRTKELVQDFACTQPGLDAANQLSRQLHSDILDLFPEVK